MPNRPRSEYSKSTGWILLAGLLVASPVHAQTERSRQLERINTQLRAAVGTRVQVQLNNGRLLDGAIQSVDGTHVVLKSSAGTRKVALADVARVIVKPRRRPARARNATGGGSTHDPALKISRATSRRLLHTPRNNDLALSGPTTRRLLHTPRKNDLALSGPTTRRLLHTPQENHLSLSGLTTRRLLKAVQRRDLLLKYRRIKASGARLRNWGLGLSIGGVVLSAIGGGMAGAARIPGVGRGGIALSAIGGTVVLTGLLLLFWGQARHVRGIDMENTIHMMQ